MEGYFFYGHGSKLRMKYSAYPKYKKSGVEWLGDVPEHWKFKIFKNITYMKGRIGWQGLTQSEFTLDENDPFLITGMNFKDGKINWNEVYHITEDRYNEAPEIQLKKGDLLITKDGTIGKLLYIEDIPSPGRASLNSHLLVLRPLKSIYLSNYLFYQFSSKQFEAFVELNKTGTTFYGITQEAVGNYKMLLPSLPEQQAITDFLDRETGRIDALIGKKKYLIELLKEKRTALISHAVTKGLNPKAKMKPSGVEWLSDVSEHWEVLPLRRVVKTIKTGGTPSGAEDSAFDDDGFDWYSPSDFEERTILGKSNRALSEEGKKEVRIFPKNTVMLVGIGATIGKVGLSIEISSCNQQINGIVCGNLLDPLFTTYYLKTMRDFIVKCGKYTTLPIINQDETKNIIFTLPPLHEQQAIAAFLDRETRKIDILAAEVEAAIEKLKEYRTALISAAVTGKIDVRVVA